MSQALIAFVPPRPSGLAGPRSTLESADGRAASANLGDSQQRRRSTARRPRDEREVSVSSIILTVKMVAVGGH